MVLFIDYFLVFISLTERFLGFFFGFFFFFGFLFYSLEKYILVHECHFFLFNSYFLLNAKCEAMYQILRNV